MPLASNRAPVYLVFVVLIDWFKLIENQKVFTKIPFIIFIQVNIK